MSHHAHNHDLSAPADVHSYSALLFDLDGTIIDSTDAIVKYWTSLAKQIGVAPETILETSHGRRSIDVLGLLAPNLATWDYICEAEGRVPKQYGSDAVEIPGSRLLLEELEKAGAPWAIVTSGTRPLVTGWLDVMKLARPQNLVTAEDVNIGKPDPACYRLGATRLGFGEGGQHIDNSRILVLEDAPAGVRAGKAAGYRVVALATTHAIDKLKDAGADWIVKDMRSVKLVDYDSKTGDVKIEIQDSLVV